MWGSNWGSLKFIVFDVMNHDINQQAKYQEVKHAKDENMRIHILKVLVIVIASKTMTFWGDPSKMF